MAESLRCTDVQGRVVVLTSERWNWHIVPNHAALAGNEQCVVQALQDPFCIMDDVDRPGVVENFYRPFTLPRPYDRTYLKVPVEYRRDPATGNVMGRVLTAYPTNQVKDGENQIWPSMS